MMTKKMNYTLSDAFLTDLLGLFSYDELKDCEAYNKRINQTCLNAENRDDFSQKQIDNGFKKMVEVYTAIAKNLFDIHNNHGFPKAKKFIDIYLEEHNYNITIGEIAFIYVKREIRKRD